MRISVNFSIDPHEHLIQVPLPVGIILDLVDAPFTDLSSKYWTRAIPPEADRFVADIYTALMQQVFNISK